MISRTDVLCTGRTPLADANAVSVFEVRLLAAGRLDLEACFAIATRSFYQYHV